MKTGVRQYSKVYGGVSSSLCTPNLVELRPKLVVASFQLMKIIPAKYIIERALRRGEIHSDYPVLESSSGTFALGMGIVCAEKGIPFHIVGDAAIDERLKVRLRHLGGKVQIVGSNTGTNENIQVLRMEALQERLQENPGSFWTKQYDNLDNQRAYGDFARQLIESLGTDITVVGAVGSGGSTCGTIKTLRELEPSIKLVGVDTFGSVLFGLPVGERRLRGLGNSLFPGNLDHACFDEVHWVNAPDAFGYARMLFNRCGLFCGPTTGAAFQVARWLERREKTVVFLAPDRGHRYVDTVYNDGWLHDNGFQQAAPTAVPQKVLSPSQAKAPWSYMTWGRRGLSEVTGRPSPVVPIMEQVRSRVFRGDGHEL